MTRRGPSRQCKRRWPYHGPDEGETTSKRPRKECISYFDTLSNELLDVIMKQSSEKPLSKQWGDYMKLPEVQLLLDEKHPLEKAARNRFTVLMACDMYPYERRGLLVHGKGSKAVQGFRNTAFALSDVLTDIYIYQASFPPSWRRTLTSVCPKLKSLSLNSAQMKNIFPFESILRAHSGQLESLEVTWEIATPKQIDAMTEHLGGLRRLSLMFDHVGKSLDSVWRTVGPTLQELAVLEMSREDNTRSDNYKALSLENLKEVCPRIQKLDFELPPSDVREGLVSLFKDYGTQLRTLILIRCGLEEKHLKEICKECPKVRLDLAEYRGLPVDCLIAAGKQASLVNFGCNTFEYFDEWRLKELGDVIENLSGFCVSAYSCRVVDGIDLVFKHPKPQLTFARIENNPNMTNASVLDIIGNRFINLEQIEITEVLPNLNELRKLGPQCPNVKELIFLSINAARFKMCGCKLDRGLADFHSMVGDKEHRMCTFVKAVQAFPGLVDVDYSCSRFDGTRSAVVPQVNKALRVRPGRKLCLTMCGNNYA